MNLRRVSPAPFPETARRKKHKDPFLAAEAGSPRAGGAGGDAISTSRPLCEQRQDVASVISQLSGRGGPCPGAPRVFMHQQPPAALSPPAAPRASPARPPACGKRLPGRGEAAGAKAAFGAAQTARLPGPALPKMRPHLLMVMGLREMPQSPASLRRLLLPSFPSWLFWQTAWSQPAFWEGCS